MPILFLYIGSNPTSQSSITNLTFGNTYRISCIAQNARPVVSLSIYADGINLNSFSNLTVTSTELYNECQNTSICTSALILSLVLNDIKLSELKALTCNALNTSKPFNLNSTIYTNVFISKPLPTTNITTRPSIETTILSTVVGTTSLKINNTFSPVTINLIASINTTLKTTLALLTSSSSTFTLSSTNSTKTFLSTATIFSTSISSTSTTSSRIAPTIINSTSSKTQLIANTTTNTIITNLTTNSTILILTNTSKSLSTEGTTKSITTTASSLADLYSSLNSYLNSSSNSTYITNIVTLIGNTLLVNALNNSFNNVSSISNSFNIINQVLQLPQSFLYQSQLNSNSTAKYKKTKIFT